MPDNIPSAPKRTMFGSDTHALMQRDIAKWRSELEEAWKQIEAVIEPLDGRRRRLLASRLLGRADR